jgi:CRP/FNR family transcriptional regulator, cyclic AMP receptor protein
MTWTVRGTAGGPLYQAILGVMNTTGRGLAAPVDLAAVPMLAQVTRERLGRLAQAHPVRRFTAGTVLLHQGAPATQLLIMLDGQASAVVDHSEGTRSRYPLMTAPCVSDKAAVLAAGTYPATWTATAPGRALVLSAPAFWALLHEQRQMREHVLRYLAFQAGQARVALAAHATGSARTRVARWLLTAAGPGATATVALPAGQQGLAEELGLSRVTVNRALQQLTRAGAISLRPRVITVLDPAGLASITAQRPGHAKPRHPASRALRALAHVGNVAFAGRAAVSSRSPALSARPGAASPARPGSANSCRRSRRRRPR